MLRSDRKVYKMTKLIHPCLSVTTPAETLEIYMLNPGQRVGALIVEGAYTMVKLKKVNRLAKINNTKSKKINRLAKINNTKSKLNESGAIDLMILRAYAQGIDMYESGNLLANNPYVDIKMRKAFSEGWCDAKENH